LINSQGEIDPPDSISTRATVAPVRSCALRRWRRRARSLDLNSSRRVQAQFAATCRGFESRLPLTNVPRSTAHAGRVPGARPGRL